MALKLETETKVDSEPCVVAWDDKLYVGAEDGSVKVSKPLFVVQRLVKSAEEACFKNQLAKVCKICL